VVDKKERILIVHNYYQIPGGEDTVVMNEKKMLEEHGHEVVLYTRSNSELKTMSKMSKLLLPITTIFNFRTYREIRKIICEQNIDVVHVHNTLNLISPAVYYAALSKKISVVQTVHNFRLLCPGATFYRDGHICEDCVQYGLKCAIKHNCYRNSKLQTLACVINTTIHRATGVYGKIKYICLTDFNKKKLLELKQIKEDKVFIKPNYVEKTGEVISEEKRENQFVYAGRLDRLKGIEILFKAWKQLGKEAPLLVVCGIGPMEEWCEKFIIENNLNVEMKGWKNNNDVSKIIAHSRALILPTQCYEGFPMSILEAFSVGTPVISSDIGNAGVIIQEGITGYKFNSVSSEDLVQVLMKSDLNINDRVFSTYQKLYTKESNYLQLLNCYREVKKHG
jgi:glycosyltransferase involved in cell wall biosynthesis